MSRQPTDYGYQPIGNVNNINITNTSSANLSKHTRLVESHNFRTNPSSGLRRGSVGHPTADQSNHVNNTNPPLSVNGVNFNNFGNFNPLSSQIPRLDGSGGSKLKPSHTAALNQIKQSLLPYDSSSPQSANSYSNTDTLSSESSSGTTGSCSSEFGNFNKELSMLESLVELGFQKDSAYYALKLTQFSSLQDAVNVLVKINSSHVYGNPHLQRKASFENADASSSRSESPMQQPQQPQQRFQIQLRGPPQQHQQPNSAPFLCAANQPNHRTPSPMGASGAPGKPIAVGMGGAGDIISLSKKCHVTVNDPDNTPAGPSDFNPSQPAQSSVFVRQAVLPVVQQTVLSRKVEKPIPQNVESLQFKQQQTAPKSFYPNVLDQRFAPRNHVIVDQTSLGYNIPSGYCTRIDESPSSSNQQQQQQQHVIKNQHPPLLDDQRTGSTRILVSSTNNNVVNIGGTTSQTPVSPSDPAYLEHLMQRVSDVLNVRTSGGGTCSPPVHNLPLGLRKRDSAASSSSDNSSGATDCGSAYGGAPISGAAPGSGIRYPHQHLPPGVYAAGHWPTSATNSSPGFYCPDSLPLISSTFVPPDTVGTDPNGNFESGPHQSSAATSSGGVQRVESPLPDTIRHRLGGNVSHNSPLSPSQRFSYKPCTPQAFKFFMEQHVENVIKQHKARQRRLLDLEKEIQRGGFSSTAQCHLRKMLKYKESQYLRLKRQKMEASLFTKIQTIGVGAFGEVTLVVKNDTKGLYAMKTLRKSDVIKKNQAAHVKAERDILSEADNEWVVKLYYSFQDKDNLFFILEYIPGGDMMALLIKKGIFEEDLARFYIAELVCAIESVHKLNFIHRDIKPDNILIDEKGHIKLTDFGLCTGLRWTHDWKRYTEQHEKSGHMPQDSFDLLQLREPTGDHKILDFRQQKPRHKAHSLVGTPNYIAPEVLLRIGHTQLCDWWSVGVILYEMVVGHPPFLANSPEETQLKVIHWRDTLCIPNDAGLSCEVKDIISALCRGLEDRLGRVNGAPDIKKHNFFKGIDWINLRKMKAPYRPQILHETDTSNFDPVEPRNEPPPKENPTNPNGGSGGGQNLPDHAFYEFTFRRFFLSDGYGCPQSRLDPVLEPDETVENPPVSAPPLITQQSTNQEQDPPICANQWETGAGPRSTMIGQCVANQRATARWDASTACYVNVLKVNSEEGREGLDLALDDGHVTYDDRTNQKFVVHHFYDSSSSGTIVDGYGSTDFLNRTGSGTLISPSDDVIPPNEHPKKTKSRDRNVSSIDSVYV